MTYEAFDVISHSNMLFPEGQTMDMLSQYGKKQKFVRFEVCSVKVHQYNDIIHFIDKSKAQDMINNNLSHYLKKDTVTRNT